MALAECDQLRSHLNVARPDSRASVQSISLETLIERVKQLELSEHVPDGVKAHFETAKNLYAYSYFVYRFFPVSEQQALASLELAARLKLPSQDPSKKDRRTIGPLLTSAKSAGLLRNDCFVYADQWARKLAYSRYSLSVLEQMREKNLAEFVWDEAAAMPTAEERATDWIAHFIETIPSIRNMYAHGSEALHPNAICTLEVVCNFINQLYASP